MFDRFRKRSKGQPTADELSSAAVDHLAAFIETRRGVEAFIELPTTVTKATLLLIAHDGEWTRRSVDSVEWARTFAAQYNLPTYDAGVVGYPQRMRDYNARQRAAQRRAQPPAA
ncbi:MAG: hypothetical protein LBR32_03145 [Propionibacteriaceae bacterium]|nr:hypothetical protein [Propionibacteriaceae bacterium]